MLLLASGLSVLKANSFSRQFRLLKRFLEESGLKVILTGRGPGDHPEEVAPGSSPGVFDIPDFSKGAVNELIRSYDISRIILLGYPDQFQFLLHDVAVPAYFWYQCSRPFLPPGLTSTVVVPLTDRTAAHLRMAGLTEPGPIIPHGVDTAVFRPAGEDGKAARGIPGKPGANATTRAPSKDPVLITVGANSRRKRFDALAGAFRLVMEELPMARLLIKTDAADKPGGFDLGRLAEVNEISENVSIIDGELEEAELASLYTSADMYIHTAEWEGFCIPVIEAMACGLPVVTHPVQGPGELVPYPELLAPGSKTVKDGDVKLVMADPPAFAETVIRIAKDPSLSRFASREGRRVAVSRFDIRIVAEKWSRLIL